MRTELLDRLRECPDAYLIMQEMQAILNEERKKREAFYNDIDENQKVEFINGEIVIHSPVMKRHNEATGLLFRLLSFYVDTYQLGFVGIEKIMTALTRNDYDRTADAAGHLFFRPRESSDFHRPANALSRARFHRGSAFRRHGRPRPRH